MRILTCLAIVSFLMACTNSASPQDADPMAALQRWTASAFARAVPPAPTTAESHATCRLRVLHKSHVVCLNHSVWNSPLRLGENASAHGIYMDAPAAVEVQLATPASEFRATIGIDRNDVTQSAPDAGSARFHIVINGLRVYSSPVLTLKSDPLAIDVPLNGARRFVLEVDDGGNGRGWDQCTWADATVTLDDGRKLYLDEGRLLSAEPNRSNVPFSFNYDGRPSADLLPAWQFQESAQTEADVTTKRLTYTDPATSLVLECESTTYADSAAVDWVCSLTNTGLHDTPIIDSWLPLNVPSVLDSVTPDDSVTLRWSNGDGCTAESFLPHDEPLAAGSTKQFQARSSDTTCFPFFNLHGPGGGWIMAIGWSGTWAAEFARGESGRVGIAVGLPRTHFRLRPGERVRSPRVLLLRYLSDQLIDGHNQFRRLMLKHYVPQRDGKPLEPPIACNSTAGLYVRAQRDQVPLGRLNEQSEMETIEIIAKLGCEAYWLDAYWYPQPWHENLGNWFPRPEDFPRGLRPLSDATHEHGMQFVLWFAPHLVHPKTQWAREYPQHIHGAGEAPTGVLKLGESPTQDFLIDWLSDRIRDWNIDIYREDLGIGDPPPDEPDRVGINEMHHVVGFYRVWSELLHRFPHLAIDNCCGGGRRIDLETSRRAWTLWRSDFNDIGEGLRGKDHYPQMGRADQIMVSGLSLYVPFHAGPVWDMRPYCFRSAMSAGIALYNDLGDANFAGEAAQQAIGELKRLRPLFQRDFYPLLPLTANQNDWYAYQFHDVDSERGCVLVFRRPEASEQQTVIALQRIDPTATYLVTTRGETYDQAESRTMRGQDLHQMTIPIPERPGSALIEYSRQSP